MKPYATLINIASGPVVDTEAVTGLSSSRVHQLLG
jgi:lactate dehydrogenase-like 2-hydroxyacid dehydrogenase